MMALVLLLLVATQFKVAEVTISGNEYFKTSEVKHIMLTRTPKIFHKGTFNPGIFNGDIAAIKNLYRYEGFLETTVDYELMIDSTRKRIGIYINITEGKQVFVDTIEFFGNTVITDSILRQVIITHSQRPFYKRKVDLDKHVITSMYDDMGYADVLVQTDHRFINEGIYIAYTITENEKQVVDEIEFFGTQRTKEKILLHEITLESGDVFRYANVLKSQRNLYNMGLFTSVRAQIKNTDVPNHKTVQFYLIEKKAISYYFRVGFGTRDYLRLGVGAKHINLFGRAWQGKIESKWSFAEYRIASQLSFSRILIFPVQSSIGAFYQFKKEIGFSTRSIGGKITAHFNVLAGTFTTQYSLENVRIYNTDEIIQGNDWLQGITFNWFKDRRNDPLFTKSGDYMNILLETTGIIFPSEVDYIKPLFEYRLYKPLGFFIGAVALKVGTIEPVSPTMEIPVYKRYYCGGTSSVRGYSEWSIGPQDAAGNPLGGKILSEISGELRIPIYKILGGVLFIDAGNIWQEFREINGELRYGIGGGLRVKTPLGSVRVDYGFKINRQPEESPGMLHFAIGEAF